MFCATTGAIIFWPPPHTPNAQRLPLDRPLRDENMDPPMTSEDTVQWVLGLEAETSALLGRYACSTH